MYFDVIISAWFLIVGRNSIVQFYYSIFFYVAINYKSGPHLGYIKPGPPKAIYLKKTIPVESNKSFVNVLIAWDPPEGKYSKILPLF